MRGGTPPSFHELRDGLGLVGVEFAARHGFDEFVVGIEDMFGRVVVVSIGVGRRLGQLIALQAAVVGAGDKAFQHEFLGGGTAFHCSGDDAAGDGWGGLFEEGFGEQRGLVERAPGAPVGISVVTGQEPAFVRSGNRRFGPFETGYFRLFAGIYR